MFNRKLKIIFSEEESQIIREKCNFSDRLLIEVVKHLVISNVDMICQIDCEKLIQPDILKEKIIQILSEDKEILSRQILDIIRQEVKSQMNTILNSFKENNE